MPNIEDYLEQIASATYGREVRGAIVDAIRKCYEDLPKRIKEISIRDRMASGGLWGDVNGDGVVDAADAQLILNYRSGIIPTMPVVEAADFNGDGVVDGNDLLDMFRLVNRQQEGDVIAQFEYRYVDGTTEKACGTLNLQGALVQEE